MKILLGMSGGIDSTYAAKMLIDRGHEVEGAVLKMHEYTETGAAFAAAEALGIRCRLIDCTEAFFDKVVKDFIAKYREASTPNPCVVCNREVKFRYLYDFARLNGFDKIATGHYAKIVKNVTRVGTEYAVACAADIKKDQSYMLWSLPQEILSMLMLPLGELTKDEVREASRESGLYAADRAESQDICFIPDGDHAAFIEKHIGPSREGSFIDSDGNTLGTHKGIIHYTVGQRKGLGISAKTRLFITDINPLTHEITLSSECALTDTVYLSGVVFSMAEEPPVGASFETEVRLRYHAQPRRCKLHYHGFGRATAYLESPAASVTPGQSAVFYTDGVVLSGGVIEYFPF